MPVKNVVGAAGGGGVVGPGRGLVACTGDGNKINVTITIFWKLLLSEYYYY